MDKYDILKQQLTIALKFMPIKGHKLHDDVMSSIKDQFLNEAKNQLIPRNKSLKDWEELTTQPKIKDCNKHNQSPGIYYHKLLYQNPAIQITNAFTYKEMRKMLKGNQL